MKFTRILLALAAGLCLHLGASAMTMEEFIASAQERCDNMGFRAGTDANTQCVKDMAHPAPAAPAAHLVKVSDTSGPDNGVKPMSMADFVESSKERCEEMGNRLGSKEHEACVQDMVRPVATKAAAHKVAADQAVPSVKPMSMEDFAQNAKDRCEEMGNRLGTPENAACVQDMMSPVAAEGARPYSAQEFKTAAIERCAIIGYRVGTDENNACVQSMFRRTKATVSKVQPLSVAEFLQAAGERCASMGFAVGSDRYPVCVQQLLRPLDATVTAAK